MLSSKVQYYFPDLHFCNFFQVILVALGTFAPNFMFLSWEETLAYLVLKKKKSIRIHKNKTVMCNQQQLNKVTSYWPLMTEY